MADITAAKSWTVTTTIDDTHRSTFDLGKNSITLGGGVSPRGVVLVFARSSVGR